MDRNNVYKLCERIKKQWDGYCISEVMLPKEAVDAIIDCAVQEANDLIWKQLNDLAKRCEAISNVEVQE